MYNASFSFRCLVLFVEGVGTEDKRKMDRLIICELPSKLNLPLVWLVRPGSAPLNMLLARLVMMDARENWANGRRLMAGIVLAETVQSSFLPKDFYTFCVGFTSHSWLAVIMVMTLSLPFNLWKFPFQVKWGIPFSKDVCSPSSFLSPLPTQSSLPFCACIQFSHSSFYMFND